MFDPYDETIERVAEELRRPVRLDPAFDARVMAAVRGERRVASDRLRAARGPALWRWLVRPRTVSISPLAGLAVAAGVAAVMIAGSRHGDDLGARSRQVANTGSTRETLVAHSPPAASRPPLVQFVLVAPEAHQVSLVGDFNDWDVAATRLRPASAGGVWAIEVPLAPGRHRYAFVVDGTRWLADPAAPRAVDDDFGTPSSVVTITERGA